MYAGSSDQTVYAVRAVDGHRLWKFETRNEVVAAPVVAGNVVYAGDINGGLWALRAPA